MNSLDPWRTIVTDPYGDVVLPRPRYGHPFYTEVPSWIHYGDGNGTTRQLFEGAFISGELPLADRTPETTAMMTPYSLGAYPGYSYLGAEPYYYVGADPLVSGFFDSVKNAVLKYTGTAATNQFIKDKGLEPYVKLAATTVATAYGGPAAGAAAGALSGPIMSLGVRDKQKEAAARSQLQQVKATVQRTDPRLAPAVDAAQQAVEQTATVYHVAKLTEDAKAGNLEAQRALDNLNQAAARGDVQAQQALQLASVIEREKSAPPPPGVSGWVHIVGARITNIVGAELTALSAPYGYGPFRPWVFFGAETPPVPAVEPPVPAVAPPLVIPVAPGAPVAPVEPPRRTGLTAEIAPVVAPATGGVMVKKHLDDRQVLHVEICVDGKCYSTSMDLAPAIAMVMQKLARWHEAQHAPQPPPSTVVSTVQAAVGAAEELIVGALIARHVDTVAAGWLSDLGNVVKSVALGPVAAIVPDKLKSGIASTLRKLKGPIGAAAGVAAGAGAAMIPGVGPFVAPLAGKLANDLVQAAAGDDKAKQAVTQAAQQATTDPNVAAALRQAEGAAANATVAHHVQDTAKKAAQGEPTAQREIVKIADDAQKGDPAAKAVADLVANAMKSEWGAKLWEQVTGRGPATISPTASSGWYDIVGQWYDAVGAALDDLRETARAHANTKAGNAAGVVQTVDGRLHGRGFRTLDDAIDWLQRVTRSRGTFTYAAAYEKASDGTAYIQAEEFGETPRPAPTPTPIPRGAPATVGWW